MEETRALVRAGGMDENGPKVFSVLAGGFQECSDDDTAWLELGGGGAEKDWHEGFVDFHMLKLMSMSLVEVIMVSR